MEFAAPGTVIAQHGTVQLVNSFTACFLMESINILCYYSGEFTLLLPARQHLVGDIRFESQRHHFLPVETEEIGRIVQIKAVTDDRFRRILEFLTVQSVHTAEIRNSRFCADTGTPKENDTVTFPDPSFQSFHFFHLIPSLCVF